MRGRAKRLKTIFSQKDIIKKLDGKARNALQVQRRSLKSGVSPALRAPTKLVLLSDPMSDKR